MYKVMIVDDEVAIREKIPVLIDFEKYGFQVCATAKNGQEALEKLPEARPDLILLDVRMPVLDGLGFLEKLRQGEFAETKVIILSGYNDFEYAKKAVSYGVKAYLTKPVDEEEAHKFLEKIGRELLETDTVRKHEDIRKSVNALKGIFNGNGPAEDFEDFVLMHCIVLSSKVSYEEKNLYQVVNECLHNAVGYSEDCLFRVRGSVFAYLLPKGEIPDWGELGGRLIKDLREQAVECAVLFDTAIFAQPGDCFRREYSRHLYGMLTDIFYGQTGCLTFSEERYTGEYPSLPTEEAFIAGLRDSLIALDKEKAFAHLEDLIGEVEKSRIHLEHLQELNFRIYYLLLYIMPLEEENKEPESILSPPEWRDLPTFVGLNRWKVLQREQLTEAYAYIENRKKMTHLGIYGDVLDYIHSNYDKPLSIRQVAERFYMNPAYLGRVFQKATGVSFKQYVNDLRLTKAKRLLGQTDKMIYEIADMTGFSESKYFIALFTKEVGMSPSEYRKQVG